MHGPWAITAFDTASCVAAQAPSLRPCQMLAAAEVYSATFEQFGAQPWSMHAAAAAAVELEEVEPNHQTSPEPIMPISSAAQEQVRLRSTPDHSCRCAVVVDPADSRISTAAAGAKKTPVIELVSDARAKDRLLSGASAVSASASDGASSIGFGRFASPASINTDASER